MFIFLGKENQAKYQDFMTKFQVHLMIDGFDEKYHYLARAHMVPNADFGLLEEQKLTFIMPNVVPMWQPLNSGNWKKLETGIRTYANSMGRDLYIITVAGMYFQCRYNYNYTK